MKIVLALPANTQIWPKLLREIGVDRWLMSYYQLREGVSLEQQMTGKVKKNAT